MITRRTLLAGTIPTALLRSASRSPRDLKISANRRFLIYDDGQPFFYLGDTAWELFHRLNREETLAYLDNRATLGFTVIQAVALAEIDGLDTPNAFGEKPLVDNNPEKPNEAYFKHVDWVMQEANRRGLYIGLLPTWGRYVVKGSWEKSSPVIFTAANAAAYGRFIGGRYREAPNLIWILGGDRNPQGVEEVWRAMTQSIRSQDHGKHLITFHPNGGATSAQHLHNETWLDFNMMQSGHHAREIRNDLMIEHDYKLTPVKPVLDGEARYENHPVNWKPKENGWFDEFDVRQAAYWAVFAGACGHTYGCHDIWQFMQSGREPVGLARGQWRESLNLPGAAQVGYLRRLVESRPFLTGVPDQSMILEGQGEGGNTVRCIRGDGYALVYTPSGQPLKIDTGRVGKQIRPWLMNPADGKVIRYEGPKDRFVLPKRAGDHQDWVVIVDDATRKVRKPAT